MPGPRSRKWKTDAVGELVFEHFVQSAFDLAPESPDNEVVVRRICDRRRRYRLAQDELHLHEMRNR